MEKQCSQCKQVKPLSEFTRNGRGRDGHRSYCKLCATKYMKSYYTSTARGIYNRLRGSANTKRTPFDIAPMDFLEWWNRQNLECFYCSQPLTRSLNRMHKLSDLTFDRKDSAKGYTIDNLVLACRRCNLMKGDWLTVEQTLEIAQRYFKR